MGITSQLVLCLIAAGLAGGSDHLADKKPPLIDRWGAVVDRDGDCTISESKGKLSITVPGTLHNLNPSIASNAPRVIQPVDGDFTATVKVSGDFKPGEHATKPSGYPFVGAGLLLWQDDKNCLRLERNSWWMADEKKHGCYTPLVEYYKNGVDQDTNPGGTTDEFFKGNSTWFRLQRKGDRVIASYSDDGKEWKVAREVKVVLAAKLSIGVAAVNSSDKPLTVEFEDFKVVADR